MSAARQGALDLSGQIPDPVKPGIPLTAEILDVRPESVRLRIASPLSLSYEGEWDPTGLHIADVLTLPDPMRQLVTWMSRRGEVTPREVAGYVRQDQDAALKMLETLLEQGFVRRVDGNGEPRYRPRLAARRGRRLPPALDDLGKNPPGDAPPGQAPPPSPARPLVERALDLLGERGRFFLCASPELIIVLLTELLFLAGVESFAGTIGFAGVIGNSLVAGIFPVLLLVSSRRKGEFVPAVAFRILGHPVVAAGIYVFFSVTIFLHGLVIWRDPFQRVSALVVGVLVLWATITIVRRGAFTPRIVVQFRQDARVRDRAVFAITAGGQPATTEVRLGYPSGEQRLQAAAGEVHAPASLRYITFHLPATQARELKVWAHRVTAEGNSEGLSALLEVERGGERRQFDLKSARGQVSLPVGADACWCRIAF
jgi:hypothetical protein